MVVIAFGSSINEAEKTPERKRELDSRCSLKERRRLKNSAGE